MPAALRRPRVAALVAVLLVLLGVLADVATSAAPASAHAVLVSSAPADGSEVRHAPRSVAITFDEHVQLVPGTARALSTTGARIDTGHAHLSADGEGIVVPLRATVPTGSYIVTWRVVSADTHIVSGSVAFGVGERASSTATAGGPGAGSSPTSLDSVAQSAQGFGYLGVILAFGVGAVGVMLWPSSLRTPRSRTLRRIGVGLIALGALAEILLQGPRAAEAGWLGVVRGTDLGQTLTSTYGVALLVRLVVVLAAAPLTVGSLARPRLAGPAALVAALVVLVTFALSGHAGVGSDAWLAVPAAVLHLAGMAVWLGGLATLLVVVLPWLRHAPRPPLPALRAWSTTAFVAVVVLIVTGEYQAWREVRPLPALWHTAYGETLLVKLALVVVALVTALVPQRMLLRSRRIERMPATATWRTLRRAVTIESCVTIAVVAATTVLVALPPASSTYGPPLTTIAPLGGSGSGPRLAVDLDTTRHGPEQLMVRAESASGSTVPLQMLSATLSSSENDVAALEVPMVRGANGSWRSSGMVVPLSGRWTITFDVSVDQAAGYATRTEYTAW